MTATPSRIGFVMQPVRRATVETASVFARHGNVARKDDEPVETFFEHVADATVVARQRQELLSPERKRWAVTVQGLDQVMAADIATPTTLPKAQFIDQPDEAQPARDNRPVVVAEIGFNFATQKATVVAWG